MGKNHNSIAPKIVQESSELEGRRQNWRRRRRKAIMPWRSKTNNNLIYRDSRFSLFAKCRFVVTTQREEKRSDPKVLTSTAVQQDRRDSSNLMYSRRVPIMKQHVREWKTYLQRLLSSSSISSDLQHHHRCQFLQSSLLLCETGLIRAPPSTKNGNLEPSWSVDGQQQTEDNNSNREEVLAA